MRTESRWCRWTENKKELITKCLLVVSYLVSYVAKNLLVVVGLRFVNQKLGS